MTLNIGSAVVLGLFLSVPCVHAQSSQQTSGQSIQSSAQAIALALGASAQVVSGVLAVPLAISAEAGKVSGETSDELWKAATTPIGIPLPVADEVITIGPPPGEALRLGTRNR